jgi:epoxyqueuosine reductase QueG
MLVPSLAVEIKNIALKHGAAACGLVRAEAVAEYARFKTATAGVPPGLAYLNRSPSPRSDIRNWFVPAKTVLVCAFRYWSDASDYAAASEKAGEPAAYLRSTGRKPRPEFIDAVKSLGLRPKISRYALAPDYHEVLKEKLGLMLADIKTAHAGVQGKTFVDTSPVLEKELGRLAGLGFRGRNTLLISEELGSYFFIGGLALSLEVPPAELSVPAEPRKGCGGCAKCLAACPTGALGVPGVLDPGLCLSYWTTQSKNAAPDEIVRKAEGYVYGCDICQAVCPYNSAAGKK